MSDENTIFEYSGKINSLINSEKYHQALKIANDALEKFPNNIELLEDKLMIFVESNNHINAVECCSEILKIRPEYWQIFRIKAHSYIQLNDLENAIKTYDDALSLYVDEYILIEEKIECMLKFMKTEKAENEVKMILDKYPSDSNLWHMIGNIYLGIDNEMAIECYDRSLNLELDYVAMENKVDLLLEMNGFKDCYEIVQELHNILNEYDFKYLRNKKDNMPFSAFRGKSMFEFQSIKHYFDYIGMDLNEIN